MVPRRAIWIVLGAVLLISPNLFAQEEFKEFIANEDFFSANFPGTPVVTNIMWETEYGAKIPGRVYTATAKSRQGTRKYVVTAVNYAPVQQILTEQAKSCFPGDERCAGTYPIEGAGYWKNDVRGAMMFAANKYIKNRDYEVLHYGWNFLGNQGIEANELQARNIKDKSLTHVSIYMHHNRLYVMEETVPAGYPPPGLFVESMTLKESDGTMARHFGVYFNGPTIDPDEAKRCTGVGGRGQSFGVGDQIAGGLFGGGRGNAGGQTNPCKELPAEVRFQQGPNFNVDDTSTLGGGGGGGGRGNAAPAGTPAPTEQRRGQ